ncbi:uncharacterized protein TNCT_738712 [Trichonephila clavata]|uniref:Uncharacterized protein n=1 Tax=Trichonephila clavata TaxID=2740835 RepID=A0A8X6LNY9_TRICU|nr:uncharacterized protein TNCT_738712 [Trichonephila clavata]
MTSAHPGASLTATPFVDKIDPFKKGSLKRKPKKSQGSSRYRSTNDVELQALPLLKAYVEKRARKPSKFQISR